MHSKLKKLHLSRMTLIEVLIAMVILVIIMGFLTMMISKTQIVTRQQTRRSNIYSQQRLFFDILARDLESVVVIDPDSITSDQTTESVNITLISGNGLSFITTSGIGRRSQDSSVNLEVKYQLDGTDLKRYYSAQGHGASWDYKTTDGWNGTMGEESVVLEGVRDFDIDIYDVDGNLMTTYDSWVLPSYIEFKITVVPKELVDDSSSAENQFRYSFSKIIYFHNGE